MTIRHIFLAGLLALAACSKQAPQEAAQSTVNPADASTEPARENPLLKPFATPFGVPPFDQIRDADYLPAFRQAMARHQAEIDAITNNQNAADFDNTIAALDKAGADLNRVASVFFAVNGANANDVTRETARTMAPELSRHQSDITLNHALFARVQAVYDQRENLKLSPEQQRLLEETHKQFVRSGAVLGDADQARLRDINSELSSLSEKFGDNLLQETKAFEMYVDQRQDLGNLPQSLVAAAAKAAADKGHAGSWLFTLPRPSINPFLQYSPNRELRKKIFLGYAMRGDNDNEHDNKAIEAKMAALRVQRAKLLGYPSHAAFVLSDNMAETPEKALALMDKVWKPALKAAKREATAFEKMMHKDGVPGPLQPWDWRYYAEKVRKARYDLDENALRPYFEVNHVRDGAFETAHRLFGITFKRLKNLPTWHPEQQVFEVFDKDGSHLGILYMDFFARPGAKRGGAWMNALRSQSDRDGHFVHPIVTTNFNFPPPTADSPSLLSFTEASTLFHEFGHALHGLFSHVHYQSLAGTNTPRDFVEFPSQVFENWSTEPEVLRYYAKHYKTGEVIPEALVKKTQDAAKFNQGFATVEYMAAAYLDMDWHTLTTTEPQDPEAFEKASMARIGLIPQILPRYRNGYFAHIFSGGYSAGYYAYLWSEVLDADAFEAFKETSLFDQTTAQKYRDEILSKGGTRPGMELYRAFRGRDPRIEPLLKRRGLL